MISKDDSSEAILSQLTNYFTYNAKEVEGQIDGETKLKEMADLDSLEFEEYYSEFERMFDVRISGRPLDKTPPFVTLPNILRS